MTIRAAFVCSKACDIVAEDAFSVASQHSISLVNIKWGTVMSPQSRCVTCYVQKIPACSHERFPMFEHNFLKAVGRTQIEGSCKVYVGKTNWKRSWKLCLCKQEKHLKHPRGWLLFQEHLVVPKHMTLLQKMRLALPVSIPASCFFRSAGNMWQELKGRYSWISQLRLEDLKTVTFYLWTLQEDRARHKVTLFFWTFPELLAFLVAMTSSELLSCSQGADMWIPNLFPVRSPRLLIHPLNWKSPHHARKCGAASWNL